MSNKTKTTATQEEATPALVPKLRFPEFRRTEGWPSKTFKDFAAIKKGEQLSASEKDDDAIYPHFNGGMSPSSYTRKSNTEANTIIISEGGNSCGFIQFITVPFWCGGHCYAVAPITTIITRCLYYALQAKQRQIMALRVGSGLPNIQKSILEKFVLALPLAIPEQQKIAECLSSVDALIAAQARKLDALKTHKKGLMQQLFPRQGETQPRLRFPEFQNAGEWVMNPLGSFTSFSSGGTPSKDNPAYWNGNIPWVSASSMYDLIIEKADHYVTPQAIGNGTRIAKKGSILILVRGSMLFNRVPICVAGIDVAFNQDVKALDVDARINTSFLLYQLSAFQSRIPINETGIGAGKIESEHLKEFELFFPGIPEQQRIADCLTRLDDLIAAQTQTLEALKTHKQGLMQQLFPSPEAASA